MTTILNQRGNTECPLPSNISPACTARLLRRSRQHIGAGACLYGVRSGYLVPSSSIPKLPESVETYGRVPTGGMANVTSTAWASSPSDSISYGQTNSRNTYFIEESSHGSAVYGSREFTPPSAQTHVNFCTKTQVSEKAYSPTPFDQSFSGVCDEKESAEQLTHNRSVFSHQDSIFRDSAVSLNVNRENQDSKVEMLATGCDGMLRDLSYSSVRSGNNGVERTQGCSTSCLCHNTQSSPSSEMPRSFIPCKNIATYKTEFTKSETSPDCCPESNDEWQNYSTPLLPAYSNQNPTSRRSNTKDKNALERIEGDCRKDKRNIFVENKRSQGEQIINSGEDVNNIILKTHAVFRAELCTTKGDCTDTITSYVRKSTPRSCKELTNRRGRLNGQTTPMSLTEGKDGPCIERRINGSSETRTDDDIGEHMERGVKSSVNTDHHMNANKTLNGFGKTSAIGTEVEGENKAGYNTPPLERTEATRPLEVEAMHVRDAYAQIAPQSDHVRQKAWPAVKQFLDDLTPGALLADVGCGNGRYLDVNPKLITFGCDVCHAFVKQARGQGHEVMMADNAKLPYRSGVFDAVISIGVIHHFASNRRRVQALAELTRVLAPGGRLMVYVWAFEQTHRKFECQDVLIPWVRPDSRGRIKRGLKATKSDALRHVRSVGSSVSSVSDEETVSTSGRRQRSRSAGDATRNHSREQFMSRGVEACSLGPMGRLGGQAANPSFSHDDLDAGSRRSFSGSCSTVSNDFEGTVDDKGNTRRKGKRTKFGVFDRREGTKNEEKTDVHLKNGNEQRENLTYRQSGGERRDGWTDMSTQNKWPNQLVSECRKLGKFLRSLSSRSNSQSLDGAEGRDDSDNGQGEKRDSEHAVSCGTDSVADGKSISRQRKTVGVENRKEWTSALAKSPDRECEMRGSEESMPLNPCLDSSDLLTSSTHAMRGSDSSASSPPSGSVPLLGCSCQTSDNNNFSLSQVATSYYNLQPKMVDGTKPKFAVASQKCSTTSTSLSRAHQNEERSRKCESSQGKFKNNNVSACSADKIAEQEIKLSAREIDKCVAFDSRRDFEDYGNVVQAKTPESRLVKESKTSELEGGGLTDITTIPSTDSQLRAPPRADTREEWSCQNKSTSTGPGGLAQQDLLSSSIKTSTERRRDKFSDEDRKRENSSQEGHGFLDKLQPLLGGNKPPSDEKRAQGRNCRVNSAAPFRSEPGQQKMNANLRLLSSTMSDMDDSTNVPLLSDTTDCVKNEGLFSLDEKRDTRSFSRRYNSEEKDACAPPVLGVEDTRGVLCDTVSDPSPAITLKSENRTDQNKRPVENPLQSEEDNAIKETPFPRNSVRNLLSRLANAFHLRPSSGYSHFNNDNTSSSPVSRQGVSEASGSENDTSMSTLSTRSGLVSYTVSDFNRLNSDNELPGHPSDEGDNGKVQSWGEWETEADQERSGIARRFSKFSIFKVNVSDRPKSASFIDDVTEATKKTSSKPSPSLSGKPYTFTLADLSPAAEEKDGFIRSLSKKWSNLVARTNSTKPKEQECKHYSPVSVTSSGDEVESNVTISLSKDPLCVPVAKQILKRPTTLDFSKKRTRCKCRRSDILGSDTKATTASSKPKRTQQLSLEDAMTLIGDGAPEASVVNRLDTAAQVVFAEMKRLRFAIRQFPKSSVDSEEDTENATSGLDTAACSHQPPKVKTSESGGQQSNVSTARRRYAVTRRYSDSVTSLKVRSKRGRGLLQLRKEIEQGGLDLSSDLRIKHSGQHTRGKPVLFTSLSESYADPGNTEYEPSFSLKQHSDMNPSEYEIATSSIDANVYIPLSDSGNMAMDKARNYNNCASFCASENPVKTDKDKLSSAQLRTSRAPIGCGKGKNDRDEAEQKIQTYRNTLLSTSPHTPPSSLSGQQAEGRTTTAAAAEEEEEESTLSGASPVFDSPGQKNKNNSNTADARLSRYYHVFKRGELDQLINDHVPSLTIVDSFYDHANWCIIAEKQ
ncbi:uncharacterized protein LOC101858366 [Aplysia californica]|uniref:Uncharacterized protein LOC101858366 n=1 Tax=Aplysia californica TaxID=6500 RepID=A0ABM0K7J1_APLCA|nr:uncharacterized protein LOC101858366 [Aplysia californica]XP_005110611.1 uncharacterized protein LOC101858366 [Aplysia californica]